jgi:hypothetical protein
LLAESREPEEPDAMAVSELEIKEHVSAIERCNQRGGRMYSLVDLLRAGTLDLDIAAYLAAAVSRGASFLVGAVPGGAGKTTVMAALLNFVPPDCRLIDAASGALVREALGRRGGPQTCYVCHEIGDGPYHAYLWGRDARDFFALTQQGYLIAANLHADTVETCRDQLCVENGVALADFRRCPILVFLVHKGRTWNDPARFVSSVHESDGLGPHRLLWKHDPQARVFRRIGMPVLLPPDDPYEERLREFLTEMDRRNVLRIDDVRRHFLRFLATMEEE